MRNINPNDDEILRAAMNDLDDETETESIWLILK